MKLLWLFLALYTLLRPGLAEDVCCQIRHAVTTERPTHPATDHHTQDDGCLPGCPCGVCTTVTLPTALRLVAHPAPVCPPVLVTLPAYHPPHALDVPGSIWQPPRIS